MIQCDKTKGGGEGDKSRRELVRAQLPYCVAETALALPGRYQGKVRDTYEFSSQSRLMVTTDRLSCFDRVVTTVPFKGVTLQALALYWFTRCAHIIPHHVERVLDPQVMQIAACKVVPIEVVVRGYLAGSAWRDYEAGRMVSGVRLPVGMRKHERLAESILTPSTKAPSGEHDMPVSEREIVQQKIVEPSLWRSIAKASLELFELGTREAASRGLILVDTKYEFGLHPERGLLLVDEIHTLDSSRYWVAESYGERFERGLEPEMLDKEPTRQWLLQQGFKGDGPVPAFSDEHRCEIAEHYITSCERVTGMRLELPPAGDRLAAISRSAP